MKENYGQTSTVHKEEIHSRKQVDAVDREKLCKRLTARIDPLQTVNHPNGLVNIVTERLSPNVVDVDTSVSTGVKHMKQYEAQWPERFNKPLSKEVVTMAVSRIEIHVRQEPVYDTILIYSRVLGLHKERDKNLQDILKYEQAPVPPSMTMTMTLTKFILKFKTSFEAYKTYSYVQI